MSAKIVSSKLLFVLHNGGRTWRCVAQQPRVLCFKSRAFCSQSDGRNSSESKTTSVEVKGNAKAEGVDKQARKGDKKKWYMAKPKKDQNLDEKQVGATTAVALGSENRNLMVLGHPEETTKKDLLECFPECSQVRLKNRYAFLEFRSAEEAETALTLKKGVKILGKEIRIRRNGPMLQSRLLLVPDFPENVPNILKLFPGAVRYQLEQRRLSVEMWDEADAQSALQSRRSIKIAGKIYLMHSGTEDTDLRRYLVLTNLPKTTSLAEVKALYPTATGVYKGEDQEHAVVEFENENETKQYCDGKAVELQWKPVPVVYTEPIKQYTRTRLQLVGLKENMSNSDKTKVILQYFPKATDIRQDDFAFENVQDLREAYEANLEGTGYTIKEIFNSKCVLEFPVLQNVPRDCLQRELEQLFPTAELVHLSRYRLFVCFSNVESKTAALKAVDQDKPSLFEYTMVSKGSSLSVNTSRSCLSTRLIVSGLKPEMEGKLQELFPHASYIYALKGSKGTAFLYFDDAEQLKKTYHGKLSVTGLKVTAHENKPSDKLPIFAARYFKETEKLCAELYKMLPTVELITSGPRFLSAYFANDEARQAALEQLAKTQPMINLYRVTTRVTPKPEVYIQERMLSTRLMINDLGRPIDEELTTELKQAFPEAYIVLNQYLADRNRLELCFFGSNDIRNAYAAKEVTIGGKKYPLQPRMFQGLSVVIEGLSGFFNHSEKADKLYQLFPTAELVFYNVGHWRVGFPSRREAIEALEQGQLEKFKIDGEPIEVKAEGTAFPFTRLYVRCSVDTTDETVEEIKKHFSKAILVFKNKAKANSRELWLLFANKKDLRQAAKLPVWGELSTIVKQILPKLPVPSISVHADEDCTLAEEEMETRLYALFPNAELAFREQDLAPKTWMWHLSFADETVRNASMSTVDKEALQKLGTGVEITATDGMLKKERKPKQWGRLELADAEDHVDERFIEPFSEKRLGIIDPEQYKAMPDKAPPTVTKLSYMSSGLSLYQQWMAETNGVDRIRDPASLYDEILDWTKEGKMWSFPVTNEEDLFEEQRTSFEDHVFLDDELSTFPDVPSIQHFMELVCVGLSKNAHMSVLEKKAHIDYYRKYFADKSHLFEDMYTDQAAAMENEMEDGK